MKLLPMKHLSILGTILYLMVLPVFIWIVLFSSAVVSNSYTIYCFVILESFLILLFIPIAIYFIRSNYFFDEYKERTDSQEIATPPPLITKEQKSARRRAFRFSALYVVLFPFFLYLGLLSAMAGLSIMFLMLLIPLSMPVSIHLIWTRYSRGQYKKMLFFCVLPIFTFFGIDVLCASLCNAKGYVEYHSNNPNGYTLDTSRTENYEEALQIVRAQAG